MNRETKKHNFRELNIWKDAILLAKEIIQLTSSFPDEQKYVLGSQMNRAVVSISSNIAEGSSRNSQKDFNRFLEIAQGSAYELESQLIIAESLNYLDKPNFNNTIEKINKLQHMIGGFKRMLKEKTLIQFS